MSDHIPSVYLEYLEFLDASNITRKLSYRKDDRTTRPTYNGCPENFRESLTTPTAAFPEILMDFVPIDPKDVRTKFEDPSS